MYIYIYICIEREIHMYNHMLYLISQTLSRRPKDMASPAASQEVTQNSAGVTPRSRDGLQQNI